MTGGGKSNPARGSYFERRVMAAFSTDGWLVIRSAGSRGVVDVVALKAHRKPLLIQCKIDGRLDTTAWNELWEYAQRAGGLALLVSRDSGNRIAIEGLYGPRKAGERRERQAWVDVPLPSNDLVSGPHRASDAQVEPVVAQGITREQK